MKYMEAMLSNSSTRKPLSFKLAYENADCSLRKIFLCVISLIPSVL